MPTLLWRTSTGLVKQKYYQVYSVRVLSNSNLLLTSGRRQVVHIDLIESLGFTHVFRDWVVNLSSSSSSH